MLRHWLTRISAVVALSAVLFSGSVLSGQTNTPFRAGTRVSVTTEAGSVEGTLEPSETPGWIRLKAQQGSTAVKADAVIVREVSPSLQGPAVDGQALNRFLNERFDFDRRGGILEPALGAQPQAGAAAVAEAESFNDHLLFGLPRPIDDRHRFVPPGQDEVVDGLTILRREAFTLGHYDKFKVPAWVGMRWTLEDYQNSLDASFERNFQPDPDLPEYARGKKSLDFATSRMQRGHMARDDDLEAWGQDSADEGCLMSNIVPQREGRNHAVWGLLEEEHQHIVEDGIGPVWIVSGPVFEDGEALMTVGEGTGVPHATYKVIAWVDDDEKVHVRAYVIQQNDTDTDLEKYLRSVDEVEQATGLDFFPDLADDLEDELEETTHQSLWN